MSTIIVKRKIKAQSAAEDTKVYRFAMEQGQFTVGSSRKADLRLPKTSALPIEGVFEIENNKWSYHSFSMTGAQDLIIVPVEKTAIIKIGEIELAAEIVPERSRFSDNFGRGNFKSNTEGKLTRQAVLVFMGPKLVQSFFTDISTEMDLTVYGRTLKIKTSPTSEWVTTEDQGFTIRQKSVPQQETESLKLPFKELFGTKGQDRWIAGAAVFTLLFALTATFFGPTKQEIVAENEPPKVTAPVLVKLTPPRQQVQESREQVQKSPEVAKAAAAMDRIKGLTAKISAKAGMFIDKTSRMTAAIGPNGNLNAPAAGVSRLGGTKTDFNAMAGAKVSGQVGGSLSGGTGGGQLAAGATGASGVGLLEQEGEVSTGLDRELIAALIRKNIGHILYCYERSLSANPNLFGKVSVRFTIGASGRVETQKIGESTLRDGRVENCILDKVSQWKFPEPKGGVQVVVTYPFLFKTTN